MTVCFILSSPYHTICGEYVRVSLIVDGRVKGDVAEEGRVLGVADDAADRVHVVFGHHLLLKHDKCQFEKKTHQKNYLGIPLENLDRPLRQQDVPG